MKISDFDRISCQNAIALMEAIYDCPESDWAVQACEYRDNHGSYELRDRITELGYTIQRAFERGLERIPPTKDLGDMLMHAVGCWDFEVLPILGDVCAEATFDQDLDVSAVEHEILRLAGFLDE